MTKVKTALTVALLLAFVVQSWLGLTSLFGTTWDDGWYLAGGKAIALGHGYRIPFLPGEPYQVGFPPLYPAVLSLVWRVWGAFPQNLWALKAVNIVAAVVILVVTHRLLARTYASKPLVATATIGMLSMSLLFLLFIDSTMSEMVYLAVTAVALRFAERVVGRGRPAAGWWVALGAVAALTLLARMAGLALGGAIVLWLAMHRRWRDAAIFSASYVAFSAPWQLWAQWAQRRGLAGSWTYSSWLTQHTGGFQLGELVHNVLENARTVWQVHLPNVYMPVVATHALDVPLAHWHLAWLGTGALVLAMACGLAGLVLSARERLRVMHLFLVLSLLMILPYPAQLADVGRYVAVLSPWLLFGLAYGVRALYDQPSLAARFPLRALAGVLACALFAGNVSAGLLAARPTLSGKTHDERLSAPKRAYLDDLHAVAGWVRTRLPAEAMLLYYREPQLYLATDRLATGIPGSFDAAVVRQATQGRPPYLVCRVGSDEQLQYFAWLRAHHRKPQPLFVSPRQVFEIYDLTS